MRNDKNRPARKVRRNETLKSADLVKAICKALDDAGAEYKFTGLCIWLITKAGMTQKDLEQMGANWSAKKGRYYWRVPDGINIPREVIA